MSSGRIAITKLLMKSRSKFKPQLEEAAKKTKWSIVRGDKVEVIGHHPEKGKQGIVLEVNRKADRVRVEGVNLGVHCIKGDKERGQKGMQVMRERSIHYSNVNLVDPITNKPTRITKKYLEDGTKVRVAKKSGAIIPRPEVLSIRKKPISTTITDKCTSDEDLVWEQTYVSYSKSD